MLKPMLQLERSFFTEVDIAAIPEHKPGKAQVAVRAEQTLGVLTPDASRWQLDLSIEVISPQGAAALPYRIHLHSIGIFTFPDPATAEAEKARVLAVTGASILYSQAREFALILTSRGPWGPFQLPTVSFLDTVPTKSGPPASSVSEPAPAAHSARRTAAKPPGSRRRPSRGNVPRRPRRPKMDS